MNTLATTIISFLVLIVAFMQWRTNHLKIVMDLFEKRLSVYDDLDEAAAELVISGKLSDAGRAKIREAFLRSKFLFGREAFDRINTLRKAAEAYQPLEKAEILYPNDSSSSYQEKTEKNLECLRIVKDFHLMMPATFEPYMRMDHKRVRTPAEYLRDKNQARLELAEKQQQ